METIISTQYYRNPSPANFKTVSTQLSTIHFDDAHDIAAGETVTIYPDPPEGKIFKRWMVSGLESYNIDDVPLSFTMPDNDVEVSIVYDDFPAPVINSKTITANGTYTAPTGVDGFSPVVVNVQPEIETLNVTENGTYTALSGVDGYSPVVVAVPDPVIESKTITANGTYTPGAGVDGFAPVIVNVSGGGNIETLNVTANGTYTAPSGVDGYNPVVVAVPAPIIENKTITANGTYTPGAGVDGFAPVMVAVPDPVIESKTITENGTYTAPSGVDGYNPIIVNVSSGAATNCKSWTHVQSASSSADVTLVTGDNFIAQHYNDATLVVTLARVSGNLTTSSVANDILYSVGTNNVYHAGSSYDLAGGSIIGNTTEYGYVVTDSTLQGNTTSGTISITSSGDVKIECASKFKLGAGTYIVTASISE